MPQEFKAACRGCHGGCVHILTVEDGKVTKIRPDKDSPLNKGRACVKGMSIIEQMYHPDRLLHPLRRKGPRGAGTWERISWDEAYDIIAEKTGALIRDYGPECISSFTGTGRHLLPYLSRFGHVLGSPNFSTAGGLICFGPRVHIAAMTNGPFCGVDYYGQKKPELILVWGTNPAVSGPDGELQWMVKDAVKAGIPMVVIDPHPTELALKARLWLKIRPGTDGALALGMLNHLISNDLYDHDFVENWCHGFEALAARCREYDLDKVSKITWLPKEQIVAATEMIASAKPMSMEWGCALEQTVNAIQTCRAVYMIPAITGNYDVPGGFVESLEIAPVADTLTDRLSPEVRAKTIHGGIANAKNEPMSPPYYALEAMKTKEIRCVFTHANNSLLTLPDSRHTYECLKCLDFFVYMDIFMTPTAELADIVLPAALWPELDCVFCMPEKGEQAVLCQQKLVQVGECKADEEVFIEICKRLGLDYGADDYRELIEGLLREMGRRRPEYAGIDFDKFRKLGYIEPKRDYYNYKKRGGFPTPTGKYELYSTGLEKAGGDPLPFYVEGPESPVSRPDLLEKYPLILTTGRRQQPYFASNNRQIKSLRKLAPFPQVTMHPNTAARYGIAQGDWVFIETEHGRITQKAKLLPEMDERYVNCEFGWWYPEAGAPGWGWDESNANILTPGGPPFDPYFGAYQMRGILCRIYKNPNCQIEARYHKWMKEEG